MLKTLDRPGVWRRAGLNGTITGLDLNEAMGSLPDAIDRDFARELMAVAEGAFCTASCRADDKPEVSKEN